MKRYRKLVSLIIALAFVLSLALPAGFGGGVAQAAGFSDIKGIAAETDILKLAALGIIDGYPDGTYKPNGNITRAEFAKIAVVLANMKSSADVLKNTTPKFPDVKTGEWYTGWVNVAASQGFVKGDPEGTFRPNDNISYAEVLTVLLRVLGYNDNLPGDWPIEYIAKAGELGITANVSFDAKAPATRADVARLASATLDEKWVKYNKDTDSFDEQGQKLIEKNYKGNVIEDVLVYDWSYSSGKYTINYYQWDANKVRSTGSKVSTTDLKIAGADSIVGLEDKFVDMVLNDDGNVAVVFVEPYTTVVDKEQDVDLSQKATMEITYDANNKPVKVKNDDKTYNFTNDGVAPTGTANQTVSFSADQIKLVFNKDNEVALAKAINFTRAALVDEVIPSTKRIVAKHAAEISGAFVNVPADLNDPAKTYVVFKAGKQVDIDAIKPGDLIRIKKDANGYDYRIYLEPKSVSGVLQGVEYDASGKAWRLTLDGTKYEVQVASAMVSSDGGDSFDGPGITEASTSIEDLYGQDVTIYLNPADNVIYVVGTVAGGGNQLYGVLGKVTYSYSGASPQADGVSAVKITAADGSAVTYNVTGDSKVFGYDGDTGPAAAAAGNYVGELVKYTLTSTGDIDRIEAVTSVDNSVAPADLDTDNDRVFLNGAWYKVTDYTVFFNAYDIVNGLDTKASIVSWKAFKDAVLVGNLGKVVFKEDNGKLQYVAVGYGATVATSADYAVVMEKGIDKDGKYLKLNVKGVVARYDADKLSDITGYNDAQYKSLVNFRSSGLDLSSVTEVVYDDSASLIYAYVTKVDAANDAVRLDMSATGTGTWYYLDKDTVIYDVTGTPRYISLSDVVVGDRVCLSVGATNLSQAAGTTTKHMINSANNILRFLVIRNP